MCVCFIWHKYKKPRFSATNAYIFNIKFVFAFKTLHFGLRFYGIFHFQVFFLRNEHLKRNVESAFTLISFKSTFFSPPTLTKP